MKVFQTLILTSALLSSALQAASGSCSSSSNSSCFGESNSCSSQTSCSDSLGQSCKDSFGAGCQGTTAEVGNTVLVTTAVGCATLAVVGGMVWWMAAQDDAEADGSEYEETGDDEPVERSRGRKSKTKQDPDEANPYRDSKDPGLLPDEPSAKDSESDLRLWLPKRVDVSSLP